MLICVCIYSVRKYGTNPEAGSFTYERGEDAECLTNYDVYGGMKDVVEKSSEDKANDAAPYG